MAAAFEEFQGQLAQVRARRVLSRNVLLDVGADRSRTPRIGEAVRALPAPAC